MNFSTDGIFLETTSKNKRKLYNVYKDIFMITVIDVSGQVKGTD